MQITAFLRVIGFRVPELSSVISVIPFLPFFISENNYQLFFGLIKIAHLTSPNNEM